MEGKTFINSLCCELEAHKEVKLRGKTSKNKGKAYGLKHTKKF